MAKCLERLSVRAFAGLVGFPMYMYFGMSVPSLHRECTDSVDTYVPPGTTNQRLLINLEGGCNISFLGLQVDKD